MLISGSIGRKVIATATAASAFVLLYEATVMDTGPAVQGRHIDIYIWNCNEALALGRRSVSINVLRLGWNPKASTPGLIDRLFRAREAAQAAPLH